MVGRQITKDTQELLEKRFNSWVMQGYSPSEIAYLLIVAVVALETEANMAKRNR